MKKSSIKAADVNTSTIIGTFEGECADSNITNKNGLDITREVWETVFASDDYRDGIEHGWFIGYLGHPEDPACQEFKDACIVMTEGHIDDNGKIYGKFNLIDTPVGRTVKAFIDAGVKFGISVRGAGDIYNNSVDPETFVFRGFDLVAFPAYPESIPEFTAIAASTDLETQKKYKAVCAVVRTNLQAITSSEALDVIQSQFAKQSEEYKMIEAKKNELACADDLEEDVEEITEEDVKDQQIEAMTQLYLETKKQLVRANARLKRTKISADRRIHRLQRINASKDTKISTLKNHISIMESASDRKIKSLERITSSQMNDMKSELDMYEKKYQAIKASMSKIKSESIDSAKEKHSLIAANKRLESANKSLTSSNLIYKQRIEATANDITEKDSVISDLRTELHETVMANAEIEDRTSNLDETVKNLREEVSAAKKLVQEYRDVIQGYQDAYATIYANAIGVRLEDVRVTSSTSVNELQSLISSSAPNNQSTAITASTELADIDIISHNDGDNDLVIL